MYFSTFDIIILIIGFILLIGWLICFFMGLQYNKLFDVLEEKEYPFKEVYGMGYFIIQKINYQFKSKADRELRQAIDILYGKKYEDYYLRTVYAQKITISSMLAVLGFALYGLANDILVTVILLVFAVTAFFYFGSALNKRIEKRSEEMLRDFSEIISKLALLTNAGMILSDAWREVAFTSNRIIYTEMQLAVEEIDNGVSEVEAFYHFGSRCLIPEIKKFTSTIVQGLVKGNSELASMLQQQSKEVWNSRKQNVRRKGEKAASKLMIPIYIMFIGILIIVVIPIFANIGT